MKGEQKGKGKEKKRIKSRKILKRTSCGAKDGRKAKIKSGKISGK